MPFTSSPGSRSPTSRPAHTYLLLADDPDRPLETRPSVARTGLLALATGALLVGAPLYWASTADGAAAPVATLASKDASSGDETPDGNPGGGDDPDGTTAPGMTTSTRPGVGGTSTAGTSAPGVTTAPGATSTGGAETTGQRETTAGQDTSTQAGQQTSTGGQGTNTTAGETNETGAVQETVTDVWLPAPPPPGVTPPPGDVAVQSGPGAQSPPAATPPAAVLRPAGVRGTARLIAPAGCPPQAFTARVRGSAITRVRFTLDGRRLATLVRPAAGGVWSVRVNTRRLSIGKHRIVAVVSFGNASASGPRQPARTATRTMSMTFSKCARRASAPSFTG